MMCIIFKYNNKRKFRYDNCTYCITEMDKTRDEQRDAVVLTQKFQREEDNASEQRSMRIVLCYRGVLATNRGCIIHSPGYIRPGIALRFRCVCVVSEQYRLAKVSRCRECDLRLNWQGYNAVTTDLYALLLHARKNATLMT